MRLRHQHPAALRAGEARTGRANTRVLARHRSRARGFQKAGEMNMRRTTLVFVLSIICGVCGTVALAALADWREWCCLNSWAMMHDTGPAVFLLSALAGYHLVSTIGASMRRLPPSWPPGWLAHTAY